MDKNIGKENCVGLSIIIPTLDRENEFPSAIISAVRSDAKASVIVSLNQSDKKTLDACSKIINERVRFKYWEKRLSIGDHWSSVVNDAVASEYYTLIPDDDRIMDSTYYGDMVEVLSLNSSCVAAFADKRLCSIINIFPSHKISDTLFRVAGIEFLKLLRADVLDVLDICPTHYTTILRTATAKEAGLYPNCHSPDLLLFIKLCKLGDIIISLKDPGQYNWNESGLSKRPNVNMLIEELNELHQLKFDTDSLLNESIRIRLLTRTMRAIFIASLKCIILRRYNDSYNGFKAIGFSRLTIIAFCFLNRLIMRRWPKLRASV